MVLASLTKNLIEDLRRPWEIVSVDKFTGRWLNLLAKIFENILDCSRGIQTTEQMEGITSSWPSCTLNVEMDGQRSVAP